MSSFDYMSGLERQPRTYKQALEQRIARLKVNDPTHPLIAEYQAEVDRIEAAVNEAEPV